MLTPYQNVIEKLKNMDSIYTSDDFRSKKNSRKKKVNFQNKCVGSQKIRMKKEEGATVDFVGHFLPYLSSAGRFVIFVYRPDRQRSSMEFSKPSGKPH